MLFILIALTIYLGANGWVYYHAHMALQGWPTGLRIGFGLLFWVYLIIPGLGRRDTYLFNMLPYLVTIAVLIFVSLRNKKENQPPASLGLAYFREER